MLTLRALIYWAMAAIVLAELTGNDGLVALGDYQLTTAEPGLLLAAAALALLPVWRIAFAWRTLAAGLIVALALLGLLRGLFVSSYDALFVGRSFLFVPIFVWIGGQLPNPRAVTDPAEQAIRWAGLCLSALLAARLAFGFPTSEAMLADGRPLFAPGAALVAVASFLYLSRALRGGRGGDLAGFAFTFAACLLSGQGTASLVALTGLLVVLVFERGRSLNVRRGIAAAGLLLSPLLIPLAAQLSAFLLRARGIGDMVEARSSTFAARIEFWSGFLDSFALRSGLDQLIGLPLGVREDVFIELWGGTYWENSLHSMYVQQMSFYGYLGLLAYLLLLAIVLGSAVGARRFDPDDSGALSRTAAIALVFAVLVYGVSYDLRGGLAALLMVALAATARPRTRMAAVRPRQRQVRPAGRAAAPRP